MFQPTFEFLILCNKMVLCEEGVRSGEERGWDDSARRAE